MSFFNILSSNNYTDDRGDVLFGWSRILRIFIYNEAARNYYNSEELN